MFLFSQNQPEKGVVKDVQGHGVQADTEKQSELGHTVP